MWFQADAQKCQSGAERGTFALLALSGAFCNEGLDLCQTETAKIYAYRQPHARTCVIPLQFYSGAGSTAVFMKWLTAAAAIPLTIPDTTDLTTPMLAGW